MALSRWRDPAGPADELEGGEIRVDARSNDYLGLARDVVSRETLAWDVAAGAGASRLISGTLPEHLELEARLAEWLQVESALLFSSGYAANLGALSALAAPGDVVVSDALNHASLIDGCRLSRASVVVIPHLDLGALEEALVEARSAAARWVVTESYFGMDADIPDLRELRRLCDRHGAGLIVDEAHALGVFGAEGRGLCAAAGVTPELVIGGMGKGLGVQGGFVAGSATFRGWLWNRARSFVFSTAPSPLVCRVALRQLRRLREADGARARLRELEARLEGQLLREGLSLGPRRRGPVFPIVFGTERRTLDAAAALRRMGIASHPIRPPTVPPGSSRLRVTLRADMTDEQVAQLGAGLLETWNSMPHGAGPSTVDASAFGPLQEANPPSVGEGRGPEARPRASAPFQHENPPSGNGATNAIGISTPRSRANTGSAPESPPNRHWIVLGTGTDVGKSFVAEALVRLLAARGHPVAGVKPVETGLARAGGIGAPGDASRLQQASFHVKHPVPHPLFGFQEPLAPSLAARRASRQVDLTRVVPWLAQIRTEGTDSTGDPGVDLWTDPPALVIETAGGVFSPLNDTQDNLDLAVALGPAEWILVASDRLGTLHDVLSTLRAMESVQRAPDWLVLNAAHDPDASSGTNAAELERRNIKPRIISLGKNETAPLEAILQGYHPKAASEEAPVR